MRITQLTNEYPPHIYGGAGVHVEYLVREMVRAEGGAHEVDVLCFGDQHESSGNLRVRGVSPLAMPPMHDAKHERLFDALTRDLVMAAQARAPEIVHGHTWYSHLAGLLAKPLTGAKLVLTTHSLEPHRPWKREQLGSAYDVTAWIERTAYQNADGVIAVSRAMKADVESLYGVDPRRVRVIHNGIDPDEYAPRENPELLARLGIDATKPIVLFVGRITRQKGILHLVRAIPRLPYDTQVVLCAGAPDTKEIGAEMERAVAEARRASTAAIVWIPEMLPRAEVIALYSAADVFVCPSVYEPFGIINLEAMACETPVVASAVGGIPEIVVPDETGLLVTVGGDAGVDASGEPRDGAAFSMRLAAAVTALLGDDARRARMGKAARARVEERFSWRAIAAQTINFYREVLAG